MDFVCVVHPHLPQLVLVGKCILYEVLERRGLLHTTTLADHLLVILYQLSKDLYANGTSS